ncbi:hypothetical protein IMSAG025_00117 [Muribaculaceae bacterium]|nr:hypothetical protein IMSAG025_00117 [Muribaculaceae bacterium]
MSHEACALIHTDPGVEILAHQNFARLNATVAEIRTDHRKHEDRVHLASSGVCSVPEVGTHQFVCLAHLVIHLIRTTARVVYRWDKLAYTPVRESSEEDKVHHILTAQICVLHIVAESLFNGFYLITLLDPGVLINLQHLTVFPGLELECVSDPGDLTSPYIETIRTPQRCGGFIAYQSSHKAQPILTHNSLRSERHLGCVVGTPPIGVGFLKESHFPFRGFIECFSPGCQEIQRSTVFVQPLEC